MPEGNIIVEINEKSHKPQDGGIVLKKRQATGSGRVVEVVGEVKRPSVEFSKVRKMEVTEKRIMEARGSVVFKVLNTETGEETTHLEDHNLLVNNFFVQMLRLFAGQDFDARQIDRVAWGISGTAEAVTDEAVTPPSSGNVLKTVTASFPTDSSVKFTARLEKNESNGIAFREVGLYFKNVAPPLAARRSFDVITKSDPFEFIIEWTITFF